MDVVQALRALPPPDPHGPERVWRRFERTRQAAPAPSRWFPPLAALGAAALVVLALVPEAQRSVLLDSALGESASVAWGDHVHLTFDGTGTVQGTSRDLVIAWREGTLRAEVEPHQGTGLSVVTDEGTVEVVGTVFSVRRDALGMTAWVERGTVQMTCADGESSELTAAGGRRVCLPTRPAMLLARASALRERGASASDVLDALGRGLAADPDEAVRGELLALRMEVLGKDLRVADALADADAYLALGGPRTDAVRRFAGWLALSHAGCDRAVGYLEALAPHASAEDQILLGECLAGTNPARARQLVAAALASAPEPPWAARAHALRSRLSGGVR